MKEQLKDLGMCLLIGLVLALVIGMPALVQIVRAEISTQPILSIPTPVPVLAVAGVKPDGTNAAIHLDRDGYVRLGDEDIKRIVKALRAEEAKDENMRLFDDTCLALMEEAMRTADGHLAVTYLKATGKYLGEPSFKGKDDIEHIYAAWQETKRECWAKP